MIETTTYVRKPFEVEAVEVTEENIEEVKDWCQGYLDTETDKRLFIKVKVARALNERQTKAYSGDWVLYAGTGFKVYTAKAFHRTFEKQQTVRPYEWAVNQPEEPDRNPPEELLTTDEPVSRNDVPGMGLH